MNQNKSTQKTIIPRRRADTTLMYTETLVRQLFITFVLGCAAYPCLEIAFRGYSHWTMSLAGGLCFALLYLIQRLMPDLPFYQKALAGTLTITAIELSVGTIVNLWLGWAVWDYSDLRLHYLGQVSLIFVVIWYFLSGLFFGVCDAVEYFTLSASKSKTD